MPGGNPLGTSFTPDGTPQNRGTKYGYLLNFGPPPLNVQGSSGVTFPRQTQPIYH